MRGRVRDRIISGEFFEDMNDIDMGCLTEERPSGPPPMPMDPDVILDNMPWGAYGPFDSLLMFPKWVGATMLIASLLYTLAWLVYGNSTLCRHSTPGSCAYLYYDPEYIPWLTYVLFTVAMIFGVLENYIVGKFLLLYVGAIFAVVRTFLAAGALWKALNALNKHMAALKLAGRASEIGWAIALVHNGLAFYGHWAMLIFLIQLSGSLVYFCSVSMNTACYIVLAIALAHTLALAWLENFHAYENLKYLYGTYVAWIVPFIGILQRNWDGHCGVVIFMLVVFIVIICCFFVKLCVFCCRNQEKQEVKEHVGAGRVHVHGHVNPAMPPAIIKAQAPTVFMGQPQMPAVQPMVVPQHNHSHMHIAPQPNIMMAPPQPNVMVAPPANNVMVYNYAP